MNVFKLLLLKFVRVFVIVPCKSSDVNVVRLELNLAETSNIRYSVSGSTITGVIEATVNGERSSTNRLFSISGTKLPVVDLIDIKTFSNHLKKLSKKIQKLKYGQEVYHWIK